MQSIRLKFAGLAVMLVALSFPHAANADAVDRLRLEHLKAVHAGVEAFKSDRQPASLPSEYTDYHGAMHVHSLLSHDSRSKPEEVPRGAKKAGVKIVMFTEHPAPHYDYFKDGHRGLVDGVLFIPGAEERGLQAYPKASVTRSPDDKPQDKVDAVRKTGGQSFLCHLEERMDWDLKGLTGSEIYNTHADFKDERRLIQTLVTPGGILMLLSAYRQYPQEAMASLQDYPADYLRRYDELCQKSRLTGVAANDAHHNQGFKAIVDEKGHLKLEDALGKKLTTIDPAKVPLLKVFLGGNLKPGDVAFHLDLDPYERSLTHVCTHMLLKSQTEEEVRAALEAGRVYVSFEWIGDPTGFNFQATRNGKTFEMGSELPIEQGVSFRSVAPLPVRFRLMRDGKEVHATVGRAYEHTVQDAGVYRLEAWVNIADAPQIWILSNPIYVRS